MIGIVTTTVMEQANGLCCFEDQLLKINSFKGKGAILHHRCYTKATLFI